MTDGEPAISGTESQSNEPWKDGELLRELYVEKQMGQVEISERWDCSMSTVGNWLEEHGIEKRSRSEAVQLGYGNDRYTVPFQTHVTGAEVWRHSYKNESDMVYVHRLLAVAKFGFDAVADNVVHHESEVRWDNRPGNLELMDHGEHSTLHHTKIEGEDRRKIADRYATTDDSSYDIAEDYDIDPNTVMNIYREFYGEGNGGEKAT